MAYTKIVFQNSPSTATPLNAENLNHMDDQIALNDQRLTEIETSYVKSFNGRKGEVVPENGDYNIGQIAPLTGAQVGQVPVVVNHGTEQEPELVFEMGAGGGGGHSIIDSEGNTMPQESAMQFADSFVSDDDVNGKTIVENIKEHTTKADYDQATEDGFHVIDDGKDVPIGEIEEDYVEVTASSDTWATLLKKLYAEIDFTKLKESSSIDVKIGNEENIFTAVSIDNTNNRARFTKVIGYTTNQIETLHLMSVTECYYYYNSSDVSSTSISNGTVISLHYGTSSGVIELNTDARHCMMSDGVTSVEGAINNSGKERTYYGIAINDHEFVVLLSSYEIGRGAPASINVSRIVECAVGGRNYSSHYFDENGLTIVVASNNLTAGHLIRMTATITW